MVGAFLVWGTLSSLRPQLVKVSSENSRADDEHGLGSGSLPAHTGASQTGFELFNAMS